MRKRCEAFDEAIRFKPDFPEAWQGKGGCLSNLGKYEEALAALEKAPNNYLVWYDRALVLGVLRRYDESVEAHKEVIRLKPDGEGVLGNIGSLLEAVAIRREELKVNKETGGMRSDETFSHHTDPTNPT
jgi:tetratricopeptide (TPR) repeat protein